MDCESFDVVRLHLGPLLQGQIRVAKLKSAFSLLIVSPTQSGDTMDSSSSSSASASSSAPSSASAEISC